MKLTVRELMNQLEKMPAGAPVEIHGDIFETECFLRADIRPMIWFSECKDHPEQNAVRMGCTFDLEPKELREMASEIERARKPHTKLVAKKGGKK